jgi:hypothetical protein
LYDDGFRRSVIHGSAGHFLDRFIDRFIRTRCQDVAPGVEHSLRDAHNLFERLSFAVDDLGHAVSKMAVMIDMGIGNVLEGQMPETGESCFDIDFAGADGLEELRKIGFIHNRS